MSAASGRRGEVAWLKYSLSLVLLCFFLAPPSSADPETVDGLYLTKRGGSIAKKKVGGGGAVPERQVPVAAGTPRNGVKFPSSAFGASLGLGSSSSSSRSGTEGGKRKAFASYLNPPERGLDWYRKHQELQQQYWQQQQHHGQGNSHGTNWYQQYHQLVPATPVGGFAQTNDHLWRWNANPALSRAASPPPLIFPAAPIRPATGGGAKSTGLTRVLKSSNKPNVISKPAKVKPKVQAKVSRSPQQQQATATAPIGPAPVKIPSSSRSPPLKTANTKEPQSSPVSPVSPTKTTPPASSSPRAASAAPSSTSSSIQPVSSPPPPPPEVLQQQPEKKAGVDLTSQELPRVEYLTGGGGGDGFDSPDSYESMVGVLVGVAFVAAFAAAAVALVAGRLWGLVDNGSEDGGDPFPGGRSSGGGSSSRSSPTDEERTPPELRGFGGQLSFVQPEEEGRGGKSGRGGGGGRKSKGETNGQVRREGELLNLRPRCYFEFFPQHFFTGQLILHEARRLVGAASANNNNNNNNNPSASSAASTSATTCLLTSDNAHVTSSLAAAQAAVMMPSPAEQVTDDLVSPKYDEDDEDEEEVSREKHL